MVAPQLLHFVVRHMTTALTTGGVLVTCYTNNAVHLWLRWTNIVPQKHIIPREQRGGLVNTYIDQCFVAFYDVEQNEPGNTWTHTFTVEPWPGCETRWFYFWGTVSGVPSPSASVIFAYHRPCIWQLYPAPAAGNITCDGDVYRHTPGTTWLDIHDGPGTHREPMADRMFAWISTTPTPGMFNQLFRAKLTFDLSTVPPNIAFTQIKLFIYIISFNANLLPAPAWAVTQAPAPPWDNVLLTDYNGFGSTILSTAISPGTITLSAYNSFTIHPDHFPLFTPGAKVSLGVRDITADVPNIPPTWRGGMANWIQFRSRDYSNPLTWPYLLLTGKLT
jgi:hypothetical protein